MWFKIKFIAYEGNYEYSVYKRPFSFLIFPYICPKSASMSKQNPKNQPPKKTASPIVAKPTASLTAPVPYKSLDDQLGGNIATLVFAGLLAFLCVLVFREYLFGTNVYIFKDIGSDTLNGMYPSYYHISDLMRQDGLPGWSFAQGMGQNSYPNSFNDPFVWLLYMIGADNMAYGIVWVEVLKLFLGGLFFFLYLRSMAISPTAAIVAGLMYAFTGFAIVGSGWYLYSTNSFHAAFLLFAFERLYQRNSWWPFALAWAIITAYSVFYLYLFGSFMAIYALMRYFSEEEEFNAQKFGGLFLKMAVLGVVGLMVGAAQALPIGLEMMESPRVGGEASLSGKLSNSPMFGFGDGNYYATLAMRTFSNDLMGNGEFIEKAGGVKELSFKGWQNFLEAPLNYCGLLSLLLAPQVFVTLRKRQRLVYGIVLGFYLILQIMPWFRYAFWLFAGDYFRNLSHFTSIFLIIYTAKALSAFNLLSAKPNWLILGGTFALWMLLLYYPYASDVMGAGGKPVTVEWQEFVDKSMQTTVAVFMVALLGLVFMVTQPALRYFGQIGLVGLVFIELFYISNPTVNARKPVTAKEMTEKVGYNDYSRDAAKYLSDTDKDFYRVTKNYSSSPAMHGSINDGKIQRYFGSSSYHSFNQPNYIKFQAAVGVVDPKVETDTRWAPGLRTEPLLQILCANKYWFFKGDWKQDPYLANTHELVGTSGDVNILKSKLALPLGVLYDKYIPESSFKNLDKVRKEIGLLRAVMLADDKVGTMGAGLQALQVDSIPPQEQYSFDRLAADANTRKQNTVQWATISNNLLKGSINAPAKSILFLSIPFDKGWAATINGKLTEIHIVDGGLMGIPVEAGKNDLELSYTVPLKKTGFLISIVGIIAFIGTVLLPRFLGKPYD